MAVRQHAEGGLVEVVAMLVGHEDVVGLGHRGIVDGAVAQLRHRVDLYLLVVADHADAGVHQGIELQRLAALGLEDVHLVVVRRHGPSGLSPGHDAPLQVDAPVALGSQAA